MGCVFFGGDERPVRTPIVDEQVQPRSMIRFQDDREVMAPQRKVFRCAGRLEDGDHQFAGRLRLQSVPNELPDGQLVGGNRQERVAIEELLPENLLVDRRRTVQAGPISNDRLGSVSLRPKGSRPFGEAEEAVIRLQKTLRDLAGLAAKGMRRAVEAGPPVFHVVLQVFCIHR